MALRELSRSEANFFGGNFRYIDSVVITVVVGNALWCATFRNDFGANLIVIDHVWQPLDVSCMERAQMVWFGEAGARPWRREYCDEPCEGFGKKSGLACGWHVG